MGRKIKGIREYFNSKIKNSGKGKIAILLAAVGVLIMLIPTGGRSEEYASKDIVEQDNEVLNTEKRMAEILSEIDGAGTVSVMLTERNDGRIEYQVNSDSLKDGDRAEHRKETVFVASEPLICSKVYPEYRGAVVISEGADNPDVCLELVKAVCALTGLTSDKVSVVKMKNH